MYKLIIIMFACLMCACRPSTTMVGDEVEIDIVETEYDGHQYIIFSNHGVLHNPKCNCCGLQLQENK